MKKSLATIGMLSLITAGPVAADTLLGLYAGAQAWNMETSGGFSDDGVNTQFNFGDETKSSFYIAFEHPIPLVPNVKVTKTDMDTSGDITLDTNFSFGDQLFIGSTDIFTDVTLSTTDFILYYELFDNDLISFDVGLNGKYVDGELFVATKDDQSISGQEEFSGIVPMIYSRLAVGLPLTGFGAYVEGSFLSIDDQTLTDYQAAITYSLMDNLAIDMTLQLGYRAMSLDLEDLDGIYSDLEFKGAFAGLEVHF